MSREREIVSWVARLGAVSVEQIGRRFEVGRSVAYEQVRRLVEFRIAAATQTAIGDPTLISATRQGITYAGLGLKPPTIRIGEVDHWLACADVAIELERRHGPERVLTERELRFDAQLAGKTIGAAKLGETLNGYWRLHWPDLAVRTDEGLVVYEVELTPKSKRRLEKILRAWEWADDIERCVYLCPPSSPTQRVVHAAVGRVHAEDVVRGGRVAAGGAMSQRAEVSVSLSGEAIEAIADRVAEVLASRSKEPSRGLALRRPPSTSIASRSGSMRSSISGAYRHDATAHACVPPLRARRLAGKGGAI